MNGRKPCRICGLRPQFHDGVWQQYQSSLTIACGGYTAVRACKDEAGRTAIYASGDDYSELYYPRFCPECGRKLKEEV